ncbi:reverse transcriptase [Corchorus capsularis]|uniref:Reverse transcriptase n=1 Tax=Corchorus capsularis TaxID=210143 RepID=A0A1R3J8K6_COCAP|nr:reverse transcriptase [Corchorus capsularis]
MAPKVEKTDTSVTDALNAIAKSFNSHLQELRASQQTLESKLNSSLTNLYSQIAALQPSTSQQSKTTFPHLVGINPPDPPVLPQPPPLPAGNLFQPKTPKFDLTHFDGNHAPAWLFQAEQYFAFYAFLNPQTALFKLRQTGTLTQYQQEFEILSNRVTGLSNDHLLNLFISGLKHDIQQEVVIHNPRTLTHAFGLAKLIEAKFAETRQRNYRGPLLTSSSFVTPVSNSKAPSPSSYQIYRLTPTEMQARRSKGLCYNCDEQFKPGHRCKTTPFLLLQMDEPPDYTNTEEAMVSTMTAFSRSAADIATEPLPLSEIPLPPPPPLPTELQLPEFQVSLHALYGLSSHSCLKLTGTFRGHSFTILVDSGSTHNLIQPRVVKYLGLSIEPPPPLTVKVGNGEVLRCSGKISALPVEVQGLEFTLDLFLLDVHGVDIILGIQWLAQLGPILADFGLMRMSFNYKGTWVTLTGQQPLKANCTTAHQVQRLAQTKGLHSAHLLTLVDSVLPESSPPSPTLAVETSAITELLNRYHGVFDPPKSLPPYRANDHHIHLVPGSLPVNVKPYRYPHIRKKDGSWKFCIDYRALNAITIKDRFPIPTIDELLDELNGAKIFSKIDLRAGYHQIRVVEEDVHKTAFRTSDGHYEFRVMPFGLTNAPSTFQAAMNDLFRPLLRRFVLVFFDDILIYSASLEEHLIPLQKVLELLMTHKYFAKQSKCSFARPSIDYLGHIISASGVQVDPSKIKAITAWPQPRNLKALRGFLGLTGYYRKFVRHYATIAAPLTNLLKANAYEWNEGATKAFELLKKALTSTPILALPDFEKHFEVSTDASNVAIGAVLAQEGHPIAFFSKKLSLRMQSSSTYIREMYAITEAVKKWRQYLLGRPFVIFTDQQSLRGMMGQTIQTPEQQKWLVKLLGFQYTIHYKPGPQNKVVDALSRSFTDEPSCLAFSGPEFSFLDDLRSYFATESQGKALATQCSDATSGYNLVNGLMMKEGRIVIPTGHPLQQTLLHEYHSTLIGGHAGVARTLARLAANFWLKGMRQSVKDFIATCPIYQQVKCLTSKPQGLLSPLPIPSQAWQDIAMDFITNLPSSQGKTTIWVVVDRLTKYGHFIALVPHITAPALASVFHQEVGRLHGVPRTIVSD